MPTFRVGLGLRLGHCQLSVFIVLPSLGAAFRRLFWGIEPLRLSAVGCPVKSCGGIEELIDLGSAIALEEMKGDERI